MAPHTLVNAPLTAFVVAAGLALTTPMALAQGKGGGGHTEAAVNNLAYPAALVAATGSLAAPLEIGVHVLGKTYSHGCNRPEDTYPNTSCVSIVGTQTTYLTPEACVAVGAPCNGFGVTDIDSIYWQKVTTTFWKAETTGPTGFTTVAYLDWGDNLESRSWTTTSTIRVETTPFMEWPAILVDQDGNPETPAVDEGVKMRGYQMWHVYGQGPDEKWGIHTNNPPEGEVVPYVYDSPYAIIHTGNARLNIAKLSPDTTACPSTPTPSGFGGSWTPGSGWTGACGLKDEPFTAELNVGGKYVYGYNWAIRRDALPPCNNQSWGLGGWWRLTFYTNDGKIVFDNADIPMVPPTLPVAALEAAGLVPLAEESETGPLYVPVIDTVNNLTYLDICIKSSGGGGRPR